MSSCRLQSRHRSSSPSGLASRRAQASRCVAWLLMGDRRRWADNERVLQDFRGSRGMYSSSPPTSSLSSQRPPSTPRASQATKQLFSYSALLHPDSRAEHLRFMADLRKAARKAGKGKERASGDSPTAFHGLMKRLECSDKLMRVWSQNVDGLEGRAGLAFVDFTDPSILDALPGSISYDSPDEESSSDYERPDWTPTRRGRKRRRLSPHPLNHPLSPAAAERGKVVALHGSLRDVVCGICDWRERWRKRHSKAFRKGKTLRCPQCRGRGALMYPPFPPALGLTLYSRQRTPACSDQSASFRRLHCPSSAPRSCSTTTRHLRTLPPPHLSLPSPPRTSHPARTASSSLEPACGSPGSGGS